MAKTDYLPTLHGWRAVAISLVLFSHASVAIGLGHYKGVGLFGVQIFFGLSGFLITSLLIARESKGRPISLDQFYGRRFFRIVPAAALYLIAIGALALAGVLKITLMRWLSTLFFMANYSTADPSWYVLHFWSLGVEEHFYLFWPLALVLVKDNRKRLAIVLCGAIIVALWRAIDFKYQLTWTDSAWFCGRTDIQADSILFGVAAALAMVDHQIGSRLKAILAHPLAAPIAIGIFIATLPTYPGWKLNFFLLTVRAAAVPCMILGTLNRPHGLLGRAFETRPLRFIGVISYSLYLWQELFLPAAPSAWLGAVQWFPVNIAAAFVAAFISFKLVETPCIRFGHRFVAAQQARSTTKQLVAA